MCTGIVLHRFVNNGGVFRKSELHTNEKFLLNPIQKHEKYLDWVSSGLSRRSTMYEFSQSVLSSASWIMILIAPLNTDILPPTQRHPHLASTKVCAQKFPTIQYFYLLPQIAIGGKPVAPFWGFYVNMCSKTGHRDINIHVTSSSRNYSQQWSYNERYWCLTPWGLFRVPPTSRIYWWCPARAVIAGPVFSCGKTQASTVTLSGLRAPIHCKPLEVRY